MLHGVCLQCYAVAAELVVRMQCLALMRIGVPFTCADDAFKIKAYNPDAKAASATYLGPTFGGPITKLLPFRYAASYSSPHIPCAQSA